MWRTLIINTAERVKLKDNWLIVEAEHGEERIPVEELYSVVIDNQATMLSVGAINALTENNVHILYCGGKHLPESIILPYNTHYSPLAVVKRQLEWDSAFCDKMWEKIIKAKIKNQAAVLKMCERSRSVTAQLLQYADEVEPGDPANREGLAAKVFFRELYGSAFIRMNDDAINAALNYGYAIIRSSVAKTLCAYGFNPVIGIHHIGSQNPFNLADDLMEPLRPLVDMWVDINHDDLIDTLSKDNRKRLVNLVNEVMEFDGKNMKVRNAIDKYVSCFTGCVNQKNTKKFDIPKITSFTLNELKGSWEDD